MTDVTHQPKVYTGSDVTHQPKAYTGSDVTHQPKVRTGKHRWLSRYEPGGRAAVERARRAAR